MATPSVVPREFYNKAPGIGSGKVKRRVAQDAAAEKESEQIRLFLKKLTVGKGLSKRYVRRQLEGQLSKINACYGALAMNRPESGASVKIKMMVDSSGKVVVFERVDRGKKNAKLEKCIRKYLIKLVFPIQRGAAKEKIVVTLVLR